MSTPIRYVGTAALLLIMGPLAGCAVIDLSQIQPLASSVVACAKEKKDGQPIAPQSSDGPKGVSLPDRRLNFARLTNAYKPEKDFAAANKVLDEAASKGTTVTVVDVKGFVDQANARLTKLPAGVKDNAVVKAISQIMIKTAVDAYTKAQKANADYAGAKVSPADINQVATFKYDIPQNLNHDQLETFAKKLLHSGLRPTLKKVEAEGEGSTAVAACPYTPETALSKYFTEYYSGNFYDRLGKGIAKPDISLTVSDAEIAAALTVLIEYVVDLVDPTPVLGTDATPGKGTTYYPGNNSNEPTARVACLASYVQVQPTSTCGWNKVDAPVLGYLASAASDEAGAVSGLVSGSIGGFEFGLGVLGKLSIGDNQMLSTIVKTAASRLALRVTLAATYWAYEDPTLPTTATPPATLKPPSKSPILILEPPGE